MKINEYESVVIINASLEDDQVEATISRFTDVIKANGGDIREMDRWGRKRLAYPIKKSKSGYYLVIRFSAPSDLIAKLERAYRLDENVMRYLTIALDKEALQYIAEEKAKDQREKEIQAEQAKEEEAAAAAEATEKETKTEESEGSEENDTTEETKDKES